MGATSVWERWDSMLPDGSINPGDMTSFNHYALGAVADFLHRVVAGLAPAEPGYRKLLIRPRPGGGLTDAEATLRTPYGDARVRWHRPGDRLVVDIVVPVGSTARVELPGREIVEVGSGAHQFECEYRPAKLDPPQPPRRSPFGDVEADTHEATTGP
jgi:alpha-L-rhamnosidase